MHNSVEISLRIDRCDSRLRADAPRFVQRRIAFADDGARAQPGARAIARRAGRPTRRVAGLLSAAMDSKKWTPFVGACILTGAIVLPHASFKALALGVLIAALMTAARTP
jgi:hypothetical protein